MTSSDDPLKVLAVAAGLEPDTLGDDVVEMPDGSVQLKSAAPPPKIKGNFGINLAARLDKGQRSALAMDLLDDIKRDIEAREERDRRYADALKRTGLAGDEEAIGGATFPGASKVVHPILPEACVDYQSMIIKELMPPDGPVRSKIISPVDKTKLAKAERKAALMNLQLTKLHPGYALELEQLHSQLPLTGVQYEKWWWDETINGPCTEFIPVDDVFIPPHASSFRAAKRKTIRMRLDDQEWETRIDSGLYDVDGADEVLAGMMPDVSEAAEVSARIEGVDVDPYNEDGVRLVYECYWTGEIDGIGEGRSPYIVTIDDSSNDVVAIYRNWAEKDKKRRELPWVVEWAFIPWRGALGGGGQAIGLYHLIGGLARAITGSMRAILDAAFISTCPGGFKLKGQRVVGQSTNPIPGQWSEIEGPAGMTDPDIRKMFLPNPSAPPNPVLLEFLGALVETAKEVVSTAEDKIADASNSMPVGTAQALIEQGSKVFSAIHARQHRSQAEGLEIQHRLNAEYLDDQETEEEFGDLIASRADFEGPMDVIPVSDPNIFSETQRYAQTQAAMQMAQADQAAGLGNLWDQRALRRRALKTMKYPDIEEVIPGPPAPVPTDPATENMDMLLGKPVKAFVEQLHMAHIHVHAEAITDPFLGSNPVLATTFIPASIKHIGEHVAMLYMQLIQTATANAAEKATDPEEAQAAAAAQVQALVSVHTAMAQQLQGYPQLLQTAMGAFKQAQQILQQLAPPPPQDPRAQADMAEVQRRSQRDQQDAQAKQAQVAAEAQTQAAKTQADNQRTAAELQQRGQEAQMDNAARIAEIQRQRQADMADTAMRQREIEAHTAEINQDNDTAIDIATMRAHLDAAGLMSKMIPPMQAMSTKGQDDGKG